jgi:hypothetical protein
MATVGVCKPTLPEQPVRSSNASKQPMFCGSEGIHRIVLLLALIDRDLIIRTAAAVECSASEASH